MTHHTVTITFRSPAFASLVKRNYEYEKVGIQRRWGWFEEECVRLNEANWPVLEERKDGGVEHLSLADVENVVDEFRRECYGDDGYQLLAIGSKKHNNCGDFATSLFDALKEKATWDGNGLILEDFLSSGFKAVSDQLQTSFYRSDDTCIMCLQGVQHSMCKEYVSALYNCLEIAAR